jgi:hypothetical protein
MKKQFLDSNSGLDLSSSDKASFQDLFPDNTSQTDTFNFLPTADFPAQVSLQVHATTTSSGSTTQLVNSSSTILDVDYHWDGITFAQSGGYYPPDNALAAGTNVVITAENDAIQITTLLGTSPQTESLNTFFSSVLPSGYFLTDPRVLYDAAHHQFIVAVDEVSNNLTSSNIVLAVSQSDPTTTSFASTNWHFASSSTTIPLNGTTTWADQPLVSIDGTDIYVSTNQFSTSGAYEGTALSVFDYGLNKVASTSSANSPYSYQPAAIAGGGEYLISDTHNSLSIFKSVGGTNTAPVPISLGNIDFGNGSYSASQYGTSYKLDAGDGRITSAAYDSTNQKLYVVFEGQPSNSNPTPSVEWAQLDMSGATPVVLNTGNLNSLLPTQELRLEPRPSMDR